MATAKPSHRRPTSTSSNRTAARPQRSTPRGARRSPSASASTGETKEVKEAKLEAKESRTKASAAPVEVDFEREPAPPATTPELKPLKGDGDDHLATYFR